MQQLPGTQGPPWKWLGPWQRPVSSLYAGASRLASGEGGVDHETCDTHPEEIRGTRV
jgi:hypothetical protein